MRLSAIGEMSGICETVKVDGNSIDMIRASSVYDNEVTSIIYYMGDVKKYGTINTSNYKQWLFSDTKLLIGVHGRVSGWVDTTIE